MVADIPMLADIATQAFQFSPTKLIGVGGFALAGVACVVASRRTGSRGVWLVLAGLQFLVALDIQLGLRHELGGALSSLWTSAGLRQERRPLQSGVLLVLFFAVLLMLSVLVWRMRHATATFKLAAGATLLTYALSATEAISLHAVDALLYRTVPGPVMAIGYAWAVLAAAVALAGTVGARVRASPGRKS